MNLGINNLLVAEINHRRGDLNSDRSNSTQNLAAIEIGSLLGALAKHRTLDSGELQLLHLCTQIRAQAQSVLDAYAHSKGRARLVRR